MHIFDAQNIYDGVYCDIYVWKPLTSVTKSSIFDVILGPRYTTAMVDAVNLHNVFYIAK